MTPRRRAVIAAVCSILAVVFVVTVVFATAMARVPQQRATLERLLARQTGYEVRFARLELELGFYGPELRFSDVALRRPGDTRPLLVAPELVARFNSWEFLRSGTLRPGRIVLRGAEIDLARLLQDRGLRSLDSPRTLGFDREFAAPARPPSPPLPAPFDLAAPLERALDEALAALRRATPAGSVEFENATFVDTAGSAAGGAARIRALHVLLSDGPEQSRFSASLLLPARYGRSLTVRADQRHDSPGRPAETVVRFSGRGLRPDFWRLGGLEPGMSFAGSIDLSGRARLQDGRFERADVEGELRELRGGARADAATSLRFAAAVAGDGERWRLRVPSALLRGPGISERTLALEFDHRIDSGESSLRARRLSLPLLQRVSELVAGRAGPAAWTRVAALRGGALSDLAFEWREPGGVFEPASLAGAARLQDLALDAGAVALEVAAAEIAAAAGGLRVEPDARRELRLAWRPPEGEAVRLVARPTGALRVAAVEGGWRLESDELQLRRDALLLAAQGEIDVPRGRATDEARAASARLVLRASLPPDAAADPDLGRLLRAVLPGELSADAIRLERLELQATTAYDTDSARWTASELVLRPGGGTLHGLELQQGEWRPIERRGELRLRGTLEALRSASLRILPLGGVADLWRLAPAEARAEPVEIDLRLDGERVGARVASPRWGAPVDLQLSLATAVGGESTLRVAGAGWRANASFVRAADAGADAVEGVRSTWRLRRGGVRLGPGAVPAGRPGELRITGTWGTLDAVDLPPLLSAVSGRDADWPQINATLRVASLEVDGESFGAARLSGFRRSDGDAGLIFAAPRLAGTLFVPAVTDATSEPARLELSRLRLDSASTLAALPRAWSRIDRALDLRASALQIGTHRIVRAQLRLVPTGQGLAIRDAALDWARLALRGEGGCDAQGDSCTLTWRGSSDAPQAWLAELGRAPQLSADALRASGSVAWQPARPAASVEGEVEIGASGGQLRATYDGERSALAAAINPLIAALRARAPASGEGVPASRWAFDSLAVSATLDATRLELKSLRWSGPDGRLELAGRSEFEPDRLAYRAAWAGLEAERPAIEYRIAGMATEPSVVGP